MSTPNLSKAAAFYAAKGWRVFPCTPRDKTPLTTNGVKDASSDAATVEAWWVQWPDANIGLATGQASGVVVVDVDEQIGEAALQLLGGKAEPTLSAKTGKGTHVFFAAPETALRNRVRFKPGLDLRADDGYVLVAPSVHPSGARYMWLNWGTPPITMPPELFAAAQAGNGAPAPELPERIPEGQRNGWLTSLAGTMRRRGACEEAILAALLVENRRCMPPLEGDEVQTIARSVARYAPAVRPAHPADKSPGSLMARYRAGVARLATEKGGRHG